MKIRRGAAEGMKPAAAPGTHCDRLFAQAGPVTEDFRFDARTVAVFDDMVSRSVPFYDEIQRLTGEIAADFARPGTDVVDLGCSTGTTLEFLHAAVPAALAFVGVDNSPEMLERARARLAASASGRSITFRLADLGAAPGVANASVVTMLLTLQFIRPAHRARVLRAIADGIVDGGCLVLVEKITLADSLMNRLFIRHYYDFKERNGYSRTEIANKREALENVLIPYQPGENVALLREAGFRHVEEFFRWYNFAGYVAIR